ncbi:hypothetical protein [Herbidospora yilanensis]|uniref:hypothetical protein n=1 Tax=Herbidospora yilanensis TaxID=354426 RepID=UPI000784D2CD|nr:hypothetical protein [Herbidospora yilanensis]
MESDLSGRVLYWIHFVLRVVLLLVLLGGAVLVSATFRPSLRTLDQFRFALSSGEVDRVTWRGDDQGIWLLTWSESPLVWHEVHGDGLRDADGAYTIKRLRADAGHMAVQPSVVHVDDRSGGTILPEWPFRFPGGTQLWWPAAAWIVTFAVMLGSRPRLGNRWAWFWLFTVGEIGALLFLVLEPRPLWRGPGEKPGEGPVHAKPISGGTGCLYSILLAVVSVGAALGVGELVRLLLG